MTIEQKTKRGELELTPEGRTIIHHSSNRYNCSKCMDLYIKEQNEKTNIRTSK